VSNIIDMRLTEITAWINTLTCIYTNKEVTILLIKHVTSEDGHSK